MCGSDNFCIRLLIFGSVVLVAGIIGAGVMGGYVADTNGNRELLYDNCTTKSTYWGSHSCSYECYCDTKGNCITCYYTCYDGYVIATVPKVSINSNPMNVISSKDTKQEVTNYLQAYYPNGSIFRCYYNSNAESQNSLNIQLSPYDANTKYIVGLVFLGIAAAVLGIWIIFELVAWCPLMIDAIADCCGGCRTSMRGKIHKIQSDRQNKRLARERINADIKAQQEATNRLASYHPSVAEMMPPPLRTTNSSNSSAPPLETKDLYQEPPIYYAQTPVAPPLDE